MAPDAAARLADLGSAFFPSSVAASRSVAAPRRAAALRSVRRLKPLNPLCDPQAGSAWLETLNTSSATTCCRQKRRRNWARWSERIPSRLPS
jgi:hypothetical protein